MTYVGVGGNGQVANGQEQDLLETSTLHERLIYISNLYIWYAPVLICLKEIDEFFKG